MSLTADQLVALAHDGSIAMVNGANDEHLKSVHEARTLMFSRCMELECKKGDFAEYVAPYLDFTRFS
jgi:hypothetical protein